MIPRRTYAAAIAPNTVGKKRHLARGPTGQEAMVNVYGVAVAVPQGRAGCLTCRPVSTERGNLRRSFHQERPK